VANNVFANGREVSCKKADGKSICAFPDVCMTPPENPATPPGVPVPYPNTGMAKDTTSGSKSVKISGKEIMLKNKSYFKKSTGDEPGSAAKKGIVTSVNRGKVYFTSWSMNVKFEGANVVRHLDLTTHNHASPLANTPPWLHQDAMAFEQSSGKACEEEKAAAEDKCKDAKPRTRTTDKGNVVPDGLDCTEKCKKAKACTLQPKKNDKDFCCHADTTGHHLIEVHCFSPTGDRGGQLEDLEDYRERDAPCVCASQSRSDGSHGVLHAVQSQIEGAYNDLPGEPHCEWLDAGQKIRGSDHRENAVSKWKYKDARDTGILAHKTAFPHCNSKCIEKQLDDYHKDKCGLDDDTPLRSDPGAKDRSSGDLTASQQEAVNDGIDAAQGVSNAASNF
jgi:hypothetical protein